MCSIYLPIYLPFSKKRFKDPWSHAISRSPFNSSNLSLCPFIWNSHLFYLQNFFYFLMAILEAKIFKIQNFCLHLLKSVNNKHTLFQLVSRWNVHQHPPREQLHSGRETWLSTMERTSALSKMLSQSIHTKKKYKKYIHTKKWKAR